MKIKTNNQPRDMMKEVFKIEIAGYSVVLLQKEPDNFTVQCGAEVKSDLDYYQAAKSIGFCIMHALSYDGKIDDEE